MPNTPPLVDRDFDRVVFRSTNLMVGAFRADPDHPRFADSGPTSHHLFVFPRTGVSIQHEGAPPFIAGPPIVTFYNRGQVYRRARVSAEGDRCEWFALAPSLLQDVVPSRPDVEAGEPPFGFTHGPSDPGVYARQRHFVERCLAEDPPDELEAEEVVVALARGVTAQAEAAWHGRATRRRRSTSRSDRDLVEHAKALLLCRFREPLSLAAVARGVGCTPFHLCRVFGASTGWTLHQFRNQVRLRVALDEVRTHRGDLTQLALELGYASHSHFTAAFTRAFGVPPSAWQRLGPARWPDATADTHPRR